MELKTVIDQIEIDRSGNIAVKLAFVVALDDGSEAVRGYHRNVINPDQTVDAAMDPIRVALAKNHGQPDISDADLARLRSIAAAMGLAKPSEAAN